MHSRALLPLALALGVATLLHVARALTTTYTDEAFFLAALPGPASTLDFESVPAGTLIPSGSSLGGVHLHLLDIRPQPQGDGRLRCHLAVTHRTRTA